jgi:hypothetical protein
VKCCPNTAVHSRGFKAASFRTIYHFLFPFGGALRKVTGYSSKTEKEKKNGGGGSGDHKMFVSTGDLSLFLSSPFHFPAPKKTVEKKSLLENHRKALGGRLKRRKGSVERGGWHGSLRNSEQKAAAGLSHNHEYNNKPSDWVKNRSAIYYS